jgi:hypothetical protein
MVQKKDASADLIYFRVVFMIPFFDITLCYPPLCTAFIAGDGGIKHFKQHFASTFGEAN